MKLVFSVTNRCNASCSYCLRESGEVDLPLSSYVRTLSDCSEYIIDSILFTGGEPSVHPQLKEFVSATDPKIPLVIKSNGIALAELIGFLKDNNYKNVSFVFSMDGHNRYTHDRIRGKGSFNALMKTIGLLKDNNFKFSITLMISKENIHLIYDMMKNACSLGAEKTAVSVVDTYAANSKNKSVTLLEAWFLKNIIVPAAGALSGSEYLITSDVAGVSAPLTCEVMEGNIVQIDENDRLFFCCQLLDNTLGDFNYVADLKVTSFPLALKRMRERYGKVLDCRRKNHVKGLAYNSCRYCISEFCGLENSGKSDFSIQAIFRIIRSMSRLLTSL